MDDFDQAVEVLARRLEAPNDVTIKRILKARDEVLSRYGKLFDPERLPELEEEEFASFLNFENNQHWSGLHRQKSRLCEDMDRLRRGLSILLDEEQPLAPRFTEALKRVPGLGPGIATAILQVVYPDQYGVWNSKSKEGLDTLGIWPETESGATKGEVYAEVNEVLSRLSDRLDVDLWTLDVLWEDLSRVPEEDGQPLFTEKPNPKAYWLNCDPNQWDPRNWRIGQRQTYTARTEKGNKRRVYDNFQCVEPGDVLIGYLTTPVKRVVAEFRITRGLHEDDEGTECIEFVKVQDYNDGPTYTQLQEHSEFSESSIGLQGSLFELTSRQVETLRDLTGGQTYPKYQVSDATENLFYDRADVEKWLSALRSKKNVILQGPPGVGKTFVARRLAYALIGRKDSSRIQMVQFHQSYAYEDFIRGYRPKKEEGGFTLENGVFYNFCRRARKSSGPCVFIIDEINRGNLSKIFGELMMLIERDKRGSDFRMPLTYQRDGESKFFVPENVYLIGMMNTADRSLAMVDYALRRRFRFINMEPRFHTAAFKRFLQQSGASDDLIQQIIRRLADLNETIAEDDTNLGPGFCIGHSYFCPRDGEVPDQAWYEETIEQEIAPLLREYWFDDTEKADSEIDKLLEFE